MNSRILILILLVNLAFSGTILTQAWAQNPNIRVEDPEFGAQDFRTGETLSNPIVPIIIEGLGAGLIILFIVIYAVKKRRKKDDNS